MRRLLKPMLARDPHQDDRSATPLELFFDLASVIAIAAAAAGLHHSISEAHAAEGIIRFSISFFAIWWGWMNFTWFASAYDNDDTLYRICTMVIIGGAVTVAAGISFLFDDLDPHLVVAGYVIMRLPLCLLWFRAAHGDPKRRTTNLRYGFGIGAIQIYWIGLALFSNIPENWFYGAFATGIILELSVPVIAERVNSTPWHRHHIIERYGLLLIIVLGEVALAASLSLRTAFSDRFEIEFVGIALSAITIMASMWWLYFSQEDHLESHDLSRSMFWAYGHVMIFASAAAVGAGFAVLVDIASGTAEVSETIGSYAVGLPLSLYMLGLWTVRDRFVLNGAGRHTLLIFAAL